MKRVVLGQGASGASTIASATLPPAMFLIANSDDVRSVSLGAQPVRVEQPVERLGAGMVEIAEIFGSATAVPTIAGDTAATSGDWNLNSVPGGFSYRIASYGPNVETGLHATRTFDIDIVIAGEVTIIAGDGSETLLQAGDTIVIPSVVHSWRSGPAGCKVAFLMIGTE